MIDFPGITEAINSSAIVAVLDHMGHITAVNSKFSLLSGLSPEALHGAAFFDLSSGHFSEYFINDLWGTLRNNRIWKGEIVNRSKSGYPYWLEASIVPRIAQDGLSQTYFVLAFDVTERKLVEQSLAEREQLLKTLMERAPIGIFQTGKDGLILYCNEYYLHLVSRASSTLLHTDWLSVVHKADLDTIRLDWNKFIAEESPFSSVFRIQREGECWVECTKNKTHMLLLQSIKYKSRIIQNFGIHFFVKKCCPAKLTLVSGRSYTVVGCPSGYL